MMRQFESLLTDVVLSFPSTNVVRMNDDFRNKNFRDLIATRLKDIGKSFHSNKNLKLRELYNVVLIVANAMSGNDEKILGNNRSSTNNAAVLN